jgi:hypothetical protein
MASLRVIDGNGEPRDDWEDMSLAELAHLMKCAARDTATLVSCLAEKPENDQCRLEVSVTLSILEDMASRARVLVNGGKRK